MNKQLYILPLLFTAAISNANTHEFRNSDCKKTNSCDLKSFKLKITGDQSSRNTSYGVRKNIQTYMEGSFEVDSIESMRKYAIVQYIKGCVYQKNSLDDEEATVRFDGRSRDFFGKKIPFLHKELVIDSFDDDPIYASYSEGHDRHGLYKIKKDESKSVLFDDSKYYDYLFDRPEIKKTIMHFSDMPTGSSYNEIRISAGDNKGKVSKTVENASMTFQTCIFKTSDVPRGLGPNDTDRSKAIKCFNWSNSHLYNSNTQKFESNNTVDKTCLNGE